VATRYAGDFDYAYVPSTDEIAVGRRRARAMLLMLLALPGSVYLYQGQELDLEEVLDLQDAQRQDPMFRRTKGALIGRDGCRQPAKA